MACWRRHIDPDPWGNAFSMVMQSVRQHGNSARSAWLAVRGSYAASPLGRPPVSPPPPPPPSRAPSGANAASGCAGRGTGAARGVAITAACSRKNLASEALALPKLACTTMSPRSQRESCRCAPSACAPRSAAEQRDCCGSQTSGKAIEVPGRRSGRPVAVSSAAAVKQVHAVEPAHVTSVGLHGQAAAPGADAHTRPETFSGRALSPAGHRAWQPVRGMNDM